MRALRCEVQQRANLQEVVLDDVTDDAIVVEVAAAALSAKGLAEDDLHVADVVPAEERLEDEVGEAQHGQVLNELLAEVVVDAEDLVLAEHLFQVCVKLAAALEVAAEGLLNDDARPALPVLPQVVVS